MDRKPLILASLLLAAFAVNLDTTIVNVALPTLVRELHASTTQLEWIVDAYNLMFAALVRFSWSSVFFALAPIAVVAAGLVALSVPTSRDPQAPPADRPGIVLSTAGMAALIYTIIEAPNYGWGAAGSIIGFAVAAALLV